MSREAFSNRTITFVDNKIDVEKPDQEMRSSSRPTAGESAEDTRYPCLDIIWTFSVISNSLF